MRDHTGSATVGVALTGAGSVYDQASVKPRCEGVAALLVEKVRALYPGTFESEVTLSAVIFAHSQCPEEISSSHARMTCPLEVNVWTT